MLAALGGYGTTWSGGWLHNETSGDLAPAIGAITLTAVSSPTYLNVGPRGGIDYATGFDSVADAFDGGANYDVDATEDLIGAFVLYFDSITGNEDVWGKDNGSTGYLLARESSVIALYVRDGVDTVRVETNITAGTNYVCVLALDRANNQVRIAAVPFYGGTPALSGASSTAAVGSLANGATYTIGDQGTYRAGNMRVAAHYIGKGVGIAGTLVANMSAATSNLQHALNSSFTVALSTTTGLVTIYNSFWPSYISFTSTTLRDVLGYAYNFDYPQTAARTTLALGGYGTFTAAYLCNEASGDLASVYGLPAALADAASPTYSAVGARGGVDKAVGFSGATDQFYEADAFNVTATDDLCVAWVGKYTSSSGTRTTTFSRLSGAFTDGWAIFASTGSSEGPSFQVQVNAGSAFTASAGLAAYCLGEWHVGIAVVDRSTGKIRIGTRGLLSGTTTVSSEVTATGSFSTAGEFSVGRGGIWLNADTSFALSAFFVASGASAATGLSANLSTALAAFATHMTSQTSTQQAKGLWLPDCPINLDRDPEQAPRASDLRTSESPTGVVLGLCGNFKYRHTGLVYSHVPRAQAWDSAATYANGSWEEFFYETQMGLGSSFFTPASPLQFYWDNAGVQTLLGAQGNSGAGLAGWTITDLSSIEPKQPAGQWTGLFRIDIGTVVSSG